MLRHELWTRGLLLDYVPTYADLYFMQIESNPAAALFDIMKANLRMNAQAIRSARG